MAATRIIEGPEAKSFTRRQKWPLLSPFLKQYGRESLAYATLQDGMEYFVHDKGYVAYTSVRHPVFAPRARWMVLSDPICAREDLPAVIDQFLKFRPRTAFVVISEQCADVLRERGFKVNCLGYESELPVQTYQTNGNWKDLDLVKRARNEAKREGIVIREESTERIQQANLSAVSNRWIANKKVNDREIWIYARRPVFEEEDDVRKFVAYDKEGKAVGFVFYDPMYRDGRVFGYSANISRCDESRYGRLGTAVHMEAMEKWKQEGREVLNLMLAPFVKLDNGRFNDDRVVKLFLETSARYGNDIYNFLGLSFHKAKYRGSERPMYFASNRLIPNNDVYLAFLASDITRSYFSTVGKLLLGVAKGVLGRKDENAANLIRQPGFAK
ncbi:MAG: DUF2156 domain-containing protein [Verrucomicrobiales bacterium]|nr:DUF2156 domain-containing protein [Verrucomicrobiales bacterium]